MNALPARREYGFNSAEVEISSQRIEEDIKYMEPLTQHMRIFPPTIDRLTIVAPPVELFNIPFRVRREGSRYHLLSDQWPILTVSGDTFMDAVQVMQELIRDLVQEYVMVPEEKLAAESIEFRNFLLSKIF